MMDQIRDSVYRPPDPRCDQCTHYGFIDSGYGWCKRYPPEVYRLGLFRQKFSIAHPQVEWCRHACGEFKRKEEESGV